MSLIPTIQKLDRAFSVSSFGTHLKPNTFDGTNKRWVHRLELWRIPMNIWFMTEGPPKGPHTFEEERAYQTTNNLFRGAAISVLRENVVDAYMHAPSYKELQDALEAKFGGSELYIMQQFYNYKIVDDHSVVEQVHELQVLPKDLDNFKCNLPEKFVGGGIIAKLPSSQRNFATSLKRKRGTLLLL